MMLRTVLSFACCVALALAGAIASAAFAAPAAAPARTPPPPLFNELLPHLPDQRLRVDKLTLGDVSIPPHRHSGSVYVYVLEGVALLQLEGGPETRVEAGGSFFEPGGSRRHTVAKSAVPGEPAIVLAVSISPEGVPAGTFD